MKEDLLIELRSLLRKDKQYHLDYSLLELITTNRLITAKAIAEVGFMPLEISNSLEFKWCQQYPALKALKDYLRGARGLR